jgi:hypothetical protein
LVFGVGKLLAIGIAILLQAIENTYFSHLNHH